MIQSLLEQPSKKGLLLQSLWERLFPQSLSYRPSIGNLGGGGGRGGGAGGGGVGAVGGVEGGGSDEGLDVLDVLQRERVVRAREPA